MSNKRMRVVYSGRVQGIGFRYTVDAKACDLGLTGWVKNLTNGSVEIVCEGPESKLNLLLEKIKQEMGRYIKDTAVSWHAPTGEFKDFQIRFW